MFPFGAWPKDYLTNLKEKNKSQWSKLVLQLVVKESERRGPQHAEQATKLIETAGSFAKAFKQAGVIMLPKDCWAGEMANGLGWPSMSP